MKQIKFIILGLILGCISGLVLYDAYLCTSDVIEVRYDSIVYDTDSIFTPITYEVIEYVDRVKTVYKTDTFTIDLTQPVDSAQILADYVRIRLYKDTIRDNDMVAYITDSIQFNRIKTRQFSYQILRPTQIVTNKAHSIGIGSLISLDGIVPNVTYFNNKWGYSMGYDPLNKNLVLGVQYRLIEW